MGKMKQKFIEQQNEQAEQLQIAINHLHGAYHLVKLFNEEYARTINQVIMELENEQDKRGVGDLKEIMLYSAFDNQLGKFSGRINYNDKTKLVNEIFEMLWYDTADPEHDDRIKVPYNEREEYIEAFGDYTIHEHIGDINNE